MKKIWLLIFTLILLEQLTAQQVPLFSQYMFNPYPYNPAYAGSENRFVAMSTYRNQWTGFDGAPETAVLSIQGPLKGGSAIGSYLFRDATGAMERYGFNTGYTYRVQLEKETFLAFGLQVGVTQFTIHGDELITHDPNDNAVPLISSNALIGDASFGVYLHSKQFFAGVSVPQLLNGSFLLSEDAGKIHDQLIERHLFLMGGMKFRASDSFTIEPSVLLKTVKGAPIQLDFSSRFVLNDKYWLGLTYRTRSAVCFMAGLSLSDHFILGYCYDFATNDINTVAASSHEIMLGWRFNEKEQSRKFF